MEKLEEGEPPAVTIRPAPNKPAITEKRAIGGKRTEAKVTSGKSTYIVKQNDPPGSVQPGDALGSQSRPAQWQIMTFDGNQKQKQQQQPVTTDAAPAPPAAKADASAKTAPAKK